ncbi:MAG: hypothetical protein SH856_08210 [Flavobacteriales bacterium]|nr:hypothetical protein [Flavobacteriales bacterium]
MKRINIIGISIFMLICILGDAQETHQSEHQIGILTGLEFGPATHLNHEYYTNDFTPRIVAGLCYKLQFSEDNARYNLFQKTFGYLAFHFQVAPRKSYELAFAPNVRYDVSFLRLNVNYGISFKSDRHQFTRNLAIEAGLTFLHMRGKVRFESPEDELGIIPHKDRFDVPGINLVFRVPLKQTGVSSGFGKRW